MASSIIPGTYRIVSLVNDKHPPVGVDHIKPGFQAVHLNADVTTWTVREEGHNTYRLSVAGYPYTGIVDDDVHATIHPQQNVDWIATYHPLQEAYTIEPVSDRNKGWTVASETDPHSVIKVELVIVLPVDPVKYSIAQLFRFERFDE